MKQIDLRPRAEKALSNISKKHAGQIIRKIEKMAVSLSQL